jgi:light-regulated signal transduction histidine kinase (bacteriophytochrome)
MEEKNVELALAKERLEETNRRLEEAGAALQKANDELELRVRQRTAELQSTNEKLEAFSYSISHDLRTPLWLIANSSEVVLKNGGALLDAQCVRHLKNIHTSSKRLSALTEALLELSQTSTALFYRQPVDLSTIANEVIAELWESEPDRSVEFKIAPGMNTTGDPRLLRVVMTNLLANAWKFTSKRSKARIEFGRNKNDANSPYFVRDNGAGFDMAYGNKLFTAFQRLHPQDDFEGTGIGLATVQRIIQRHRGRIWAEGVPTKGATFYFTLGGESSTISSEIFSRPSELCVCPGNHAANGN